MRLTDVCFEEDQTCREVLSRELPAECSPLPRPKNGYCHSENLFEGVKAECDCNEGYSWSDQALSEIPGNGPKNQTYLQMLCVRDFDNVTVVWQVTNREKTLLNANTSILNCEVAKQTKCQGLTFTIKVVV